MSRGIPTLISVLIALLLAGLAGQALAGGSYYRTAQVVDTVPIYETVRVSEPGHACRDERVVHHEPRRGSAAGIVAGGIIGGVVGNQFGKGRGRHAATVAGSVLGATIGEHASRRDGRTWTSTERHCRPVSRWYEEDRIVAYRVQYRYRGDTYWTEMPHRPGDTIRVRVDVTPVR